MDWGLGHTTRCIPLIRELLRLQCDVIIACTPNQRAILEVEFQALNFFVQASSSPVYGKTRMATLFKLLFQVPKMLTHVKRENRWLQQFLTTNPVDAIISDNRFGLHAPGIPSIFITHQLHIKTGLGRLLNVLAQRFNNHYIKKFRSCWVPDYPNPNSLAGDLANPARQPEIPVKYIGPLSRFEPCRENTNALDVLVILSGPEPQRSLLEKKLIAEFGSYTGRAVLVRGLPESSGLPALPQNVKAFNHLPAARLNEMICSAKMIIARCGYTTVMDLVKLKKRSILVPTPGQSEQEYLAKHLLSRQLAYTISQNRFSLTHVLKEAEVFPFKIPALPMEEYKLVLEEFVLELKQNILQKKTG